MNIQGLQKLTLLDFPDKLACTIFTGFCNLRCSYCHNSSLITAEGTPLDWAEVSEFLKGRVGKLQGVCVTGGEPTLHGDLGRYLEEIKSLGFLTKLDTNGTRPDTLIELVCGGLIDYVALDVKNAPARYQETVGVLNFDFAQVKESIDFLLSGAVAYEFRTTVVRELHTKHDLLELARQIKGAQRYFLQQFEAGADVLQAGLHTYSKEEMLELELLIKGLIPVVKLRGI